MGNSSHSGLRALPAVDKLLAHPALEPVRETLGREWITAAARRVLDEAREAIRAGEEAPPLDALAGDVACRCQELRFGGLRRVINATGVLLHTNLGRAAIAPGVVHRAMEAAAGSVSVEMDLSTGERGNRYETVQRLLSALTGCESSVVVNNNAAAVLLVLNTFSRGRDVVLSRGEMIEIGGSFRLPEIIRSSGANLVEIGTTNRTHLSDYRKAMGERTAILMKAHTSNYKVEGFTSSVPARDLVELTSGTETLVYEDLGSGSLVDLSTYGLTPEPTVQQVLAGGVPIVSFSGDKLLGGPQAGIIVGARKAIDAILQNHLLRALRVDKFTMALLEGTLQSYLDPSGPASTVPTHFLLSRSPDQLQRAAEAIVSAAMPETLELSVAADSAAVGGGACPTDRLPTWTIQVFHPKAGPGELARRFRSFPMPVLGRVRDERFCLDVRSVFPDEESVVIDTLRALDRQIKEERCPPSSER